MAVNATEVLYLTSGLFKAVPSKAILTDLVKFDGTIDGLAASLGTSPYAVNAFPFSNAEKAKTLAENLLGSTVADKAAAVTALEGILNANGGNVGIAAAAGIRAILSDAAFADAKAQLENRVKVAAAYVDSNKGNEISTSILDAVTNDAATVTTAIESLTGTTGGNEAGADRVLTTAQDILTGTAGNDNFRAVAGANTGNQDQSTLNSSDIIDGAAGNDTLIVNLVNGGAAANYGGGARIKNIETLKLGTNATASFDYNVNQGQNEITDVTTIVADQINTGETLTIRNLVRDAADKALPTLSWINDSTAVNGQAGTVNVAYRAAAVSGTADEQAINLTNVRAGTLNINAGIEKAVVASTGTSTNSIRTIDSITGTTTTLKEVVINAEATAALGEGRIISDVNGTRGLEVARAPANDNTQHVSFVNVGSSVTKVDASGSKGNVNVAFTDTATAVANTFIGGEGNDQVVVNGGNDNLSGGKGNDTFIFGQTNSSSNGTFFNNSDTIDGGEGTDTIQFDYGNGNVIIQTSEWLNSKGIDAIDLRGQNNRVQLDDAFVARADAGSFEVITNKIVQNDSTTSVADEANSRHQIDLTTVTASRAVKVTGGEGRETVIVTDALNGVQTISGGNGLDALVVQNGATLTGQDLQNVSGINVFNLVKTSANAQSFQIDLTADFLTKAIDANAAAGTSKNTANAFRIVTDTRDTNAATISGVQTLAAGDSVTITVDTAGLTTVDAINVRDLIASGATINVRNTSGTTLLAAANGAVTTNTDIFAGVTGNNYNYTDLTTNPIAGVGTPVASGQASTGGGGGGGVAPVAGNTFTLTAGTDIVSASSSNIPGATTTFFTSGSDTVTGGAGTVNNGDILVDGSTTDTDVLNAQLIGAYTPANLTNIETLNFELLANSAIDLTNAAGYNTIGLTGAGRTATITNLNEGRTINVNSNNMIVDLQARTAAANNAATVNLNGVTGVTLNATGGSDIDVLTLAIGSTTNTMTLGHDFSAAGDQITVTGTGNLTISATEAIATGVRIAGTTPANFTLAVDDSANNNGITLNLANVTGLDNLTLTDGAASNAITLQNVNSGVTTTFANEVGTVSVDGTNSVSDTHTLVIGGTSTTDRVGDITTTDLATLNVNLGTLASATEAFTINMGNVAGTQSLVFGASNVGVNLTVTNAEVVNASALTGTFTIGTNNSATAMQITGSATAVNSIVGSAQTDQITLGTAADVITMTDGDDTINLGVDTAADIVSYVGSTSAAAVNAATGPIIQNFTIGTDKIRLDKSDMSLGGTANGASTVLSAGDVYVGAAGSMTAATAYTVTVLNAVGYANVGAAEDAVAGQSTSATGGIVIFFDTTLGYARAFLDADIGADGNLTDTAVIANFTGITTLAGVTFSNIDFYMQA